MAEPPAGSDRVGSGDPDWRQCGPTATAIRAFGVLDSALRRLPGGQGHAWTDGRLVLKPVGFEPEHRWVCEVYAAWDSHDEVRVPVPVPVPVPSRRQSQAPESTWTSDRWGAHVFVAGHDVDISRDIATVKAASDSFHRRLAPMPRPAFIDERHDPWAYGDRLAWEGAAPEGDQETLDIIARVMGHLAPISGGEQVIHGDILPNVLLADGLPPAVIDWPPYFRPVGLANAIAVTDAVTFHAAPVSLLDEWATGDDWNQLLVRALLYRLGPTGFFAARRRLTGSLLTHVQRLQVVLDAVLAR